MNVLKELIELGDHFVANGAVKVIHQPIGIELIDQGGPVACESPWLCERYADLEMWIELFLWFGDGKPDVRAVISAAHSEADGFNILARSLAPYVVGLGDRRDYEQRAMFRYVPKDLQDLQGATKVALPEPSNVARSMVWLHPMDEFDRVVRDASDGDALTILEAVRSSWPLEEDREGGVSARPIDPQFADQIVQGRPEVLNEVGHDEADFFWGGLGLRGDNPVVFPIPRPSIFADEVWLPAPELLKGVVKQTAMMVRPIDLSPYDRGPRLALELPVQAGSQHAT